MRDVDRYPNGADSRPRPLTITYDENTTERMLEQLARVPAADLEKLSAFDTSTQAMTVASLPRRPDYCFIDGEHTHGAVLRDACFCAEAN